MLRRNLPLALGVMLLWACGDRTPVGLFEIGPSGGTIDVAEINAKLEVPAGALSSETELKLGAGDESGLPAWAVRGTAVELGPAGVTFQKAAKLTIGYAVENLPQKETTWLRMVQLLPNGKPGPTLFVAHDSAAATVSAKVTKTGTYVLADLKLSDALMQTKKDKIKDVDVLFVVDNSNSMQEEQQNLAKNFPEFIKVLDAAKLDYRVGIIGTDLGAGNYALPSCEVAGGDGGKLIKKSTCAHTPKDPWIENIGGKSNLSSGTVVDAFSCLAQIGTGGCGFEFTLESARKALDPTLNVNPGFIRKDAALAVVILTDEDDCSAAKEKLFDPNQTQLNDPLGPLTSFRCFEFGVQCDCGGKKCERTLTGTRTSCKPAFDYLFQVDEYKKFFGGLKPPGRLLMTAVAGPTSKVEVGMNGNNPLLKPSCQSAQGKGVPAIRIKALMDGLGDSGYFNEGLDSAKNKVPVNICSSDFGPALRHVGEMVTKQTLLNWCLPYKPADTNPLTPALDADCVVVGTKAGQLPACAPGSSKPCFQVKSAASCTPSSTVLQVKNIGPGALGDQVYAMCLVP